jgi:hypothetical protein
MTIRSLYAALSIGILAQPAFAGTVMTKALLEENKIKGDEVLVRDALAELFLKNGCKIPKKLSDKIIQRKASTNPWLPTELSNAAGEILSKKATKIAGTGLLPVLHIVEYGDASAPKRLLVQGTQTYLRLDPSALLDPGYDNFAYTLDCSGFLNASISVGADFTVGEMKSDASTALQSQQTLLAMRAKLFFPVAMALNADVFPVRLAERDRIDLLFALNAALSTQPATTQIRSWKQLPVVWTSKNGASSFQGRASVSATGGANLGLVSASANTSAGGSITRKVNFSQFNTYILPDIDTDIISVSLADVRAMTSSLVRRTPLARKMQRIDNKYVATLDLPENVCRVGWKLVDAAGVVQAISVTPNVGAACSLEIGPFAADAATPTGFRLLAKDALGTGDLELQFGLE